MSRSKVRDTDIGKRMVEEMNLEAFVDSYPLVTGRSLEIIGGGEAPDFEALIDGVPMGLELTEIRDADDPDDYLAEVFRIADKKASSYRRHGSFASRPIMLVCHSDGLPFFDFQDAMSHTYWEDFDLLGFAEIWLMDLSAAYYSAQDPRRPADLFGLTPKQWRGFHRIGMKDRKPFG